MSSAVSITAIAHDLDKLRSRWEWRLGNWAQWVSGPMGTGYAAISDGPGSAPSPVESDAEAVEALMLRLKRHRRPLYRACWQCYVMRRDDITASEALRCSVQDYLRRLDSAYRALEMFDG